MLIPTIVVLALLGWDCLDARRWEVAYRDAADEDWTVAGLYRSWAWAQVVAGWLRLAHDRVVITERAG